MAAASETSPVPARTDRDAVVQYTLRASALGRALIATTDRGVAAVLLGDEDRALERELARRFAGHAVDRREEPPAALVDRVVALLDGAADADADALPLDVRGTPFQLRVWRALRDLDAGEVVDYGELARRVGRPSAVRAVASACGANPLAVVTPCHRVVRRDGGLGGYRWGLGRKRALLRRERPDAG